MILDTNAVSALVEDDDAAWEALNGMGTLQVPVIAFAEYEYGLRGSNQAERLRRNFDLLLRQSQRLVIEWDTAIIYAGIQHRLKRRGQPIPTNDLWIAALAVQHSLPILSRDTHFDAVEGVSRIGW